MTHSIVFIDKIAAIINMGADDYFQNNSEVVPNYSMLGDSYLLPCTAVLGEKARSHCIRRAQETVAGTMATRIKVLILMVLPVRLLGSHFFGDLFK
tara:strand:+ start:174 stop:461 length:288 start_codon:yes stop_codon:yes gene_type:complete